MPLAATVLFKPLYPTNKIALPPLSADDKARTIPAAWASAHPEQDSTTDDLRRQAIQAYHASTSYMDSQFGRVVDALDRLGLAQNTVIVFTSDHGYHLGDHGLWQKQSLFERSAHVPLIVVAPGAKANGRTAAGVVEMVDIYPTIADLAGLPPPAYLDGTSLRPMLDDAEASVKSAAFSQVRRPGKIDGYSVRSGPWRYTEWTSEAGQKVGAQLFDEDADAAEATNLATDPRQAATVQDLSAMLAAYRVKR